VSPNVVGILTLFAQSVRAVGNHDAGDFQALQSGQVPKILAGTKVRLFLQGHL
jgi:hypothetical protein